ncbi:MAG: hypothetical protein JWQ25_3159 [Daejeonella sp.]|nr:hypothetical protein [Daejeonella sp.]
MEKELASEFNDTTEELLRLLLSFNNEEFNTSPFEGSWTAAQLAEHILRSDILFINTLNGPSKTTERQPDENIKGFKEMMLNFNSKLNSPEKIVPPAGIYQKENLLDNLSKTSLQLKYLIKTSDLSKTYNHPILGEITRLEIFYFIIYHTQRHIHQLKNIIEKVCVKVT